MSASNELQTLIFNRLIADVNVHAHVADRILDRVPRNPNGKPSVTFPYVSFGPSDYIEDDADCITGRVETIQIDCWSRYQGGFKEVKAIADAVKTSLHLYSADLGTNALVELRVETVRVFRTVDGLGSQAAISLQAMIEEN